MFEAYISLSINILDIFVTSSFVNCLSIVFSSRFCNIHRPFQTNWVGYIFPFKSSSMVFIAWMTISSWKCLPTT